jgi:hypothetical protein
MAVPAVQSCNRKVAAARPQGAGAGRGPGRGAGGAGRAAGLYPIAGLRAQITESCVGTLCAGAVLICTSFSPVTASCCMRLAVSGSTKSE